MRLAALSTLTVTEKSTPTRRSAPDRSFGRILSEGSLYSAPCEDLKLKAPR